MNMTVSVYEAFVMRSPAIRVMRMMDASQSASYAQGSREGRRAMWNSWMQTISHITHAMTDSVIGGVSTLTWNGEVINIERLKQKFVQMFGRRAVE